MDTKKLNKTYKTFCNTLLSNYTMYFTCESKDNDNVVNKDFYVNLDDVGIEDVLKVFKHVKFVNRIPTKVSITNRFITHIAINVKSFEKLKNDYSNNDLFIEYTKNNEIGAILLNHIFENTTNLIEDFNIMDDGVIYYDIYDSVVSSSYIGIYGKKENFPLFKASSLAETTSKEDYQVSFSCKETGIISAAFNTMPMSINGIFYEAIPGSFMKMDKNNLKISFIGSEFKEETIDDLSNLRITMDINFIPKNDRHSFFNNKEEFKRFNDFVEYVKSGRNDEDTTEFNFDLAIDNITIVCEGNNKDKFKSSKGLLNSVLKLIEADMDNVIPTIKTRDDKENESYVTFDTEDMHNTFTLKLAR